MQTFVDLNAVFPPTRQLSDMGTLEQGTLIFSNRTDRPLPALHSFGIHCVPHIGVYGENYSIALPMVILSLQPSLDILKRVPSDPLNALNVDLQTLHDLSLRIIAQELVSRVLSYASKFYHGFMTWRRGRRGQVFEKRIHREKDDSDEDSPPNRTPCAVTVSLHNENGDCDEPRTVRTVSMDDELEEKMSSDDNEQMLRRVARLLVRKVIHAAHIRFEPLYRASSIEDLMSSTKRLKLTKSPSGTPPLTPADMNRAELLSLSTAESSQSSSENESDVTGSLENDPTSSHFIQESSLEENIHKNLGKKRQRSASHEANMQQDLDKIRLRFQKVLQVDVSSQIDPIYEDQLKENNFPEPGPPLGLNSDGITVSTVKSDLRKMSIMEVEEESKEKEEEQYAVLETITEPVRSTCDVKLETENHSTFDKYSFARVNQEEAEEEDNYDSSVHFMHPHHSRQNSDTLPHPESYTIPNLDYYIIIHSHPTPGVCQKFLCDNTNEVNLIFHCWLFSDLPLDPTISVTQQMSMGAFEPHGVSPVHLDLADGGLPFFFTDSRTVCIHDCCFSPENAQLQLPSNASVSSHFRSFYSVGSHTDRMVLTYHIIPATKEAEEELRLVLQQQVGGNDALSGLLEMISLKFPDLGKSIFYLIEPILN